MNWALRNYLILDLGCSSKDILEFFEVLENALISSQKWHLLVLNNSFNAAMLTDILILIILCINQIITFIPFFLEELVNLYPLLT